MIQYPSPKMGQYQVATPISSIISVIKEYKRRGFEIVFSSSRNMRTYEGNVGKINANTLPKILNWLDENEIPYDEVYVGKPWCGYEGFYVDDKAVRPAEFVNLSYDEILALLERDKLKKIR